MLETSSQEQVFFHDENILVTKSRIVVMAQTLTIPLAGVTTVKVCEDKGRSGDIFVGVLVLAFILSVVLGVTTRSFPVGLFSVAGGFVAAFFLSLYFARSKLVITTAAGEKCTLRSPDKAYLDRILAAINEAVAACG